MIGDIWVELWHKALLEIWKVWAEACFQLLTPTLDSVEVTMEQLDLEPQSIRSRFDHLHTVLYHSAFLLVGDL
jgi:hypothetical protein